MQGAGQVASLVKRDLGSSFTDQRVLLGQPKKAPIGRPPTKADWQTISPESFSLRGPNYLSDKIKVPSSEALYDSIEGGISVQNAYVCIDPYLSTLAHNLNLRT